MEDGSLLWLCGAIQNRKVIMKLLDTDLVPLGMGCWPIGGPMFAGAAPLGYANADDDESIRAIHAALASGITLFDTAAVYGAGHAERLLARALEGRPEALVATKIGIAIDEETRQLLGEETDPLAVLPAIDRCLARLRRDRIDILFLHLNDLPVSRAEPLFEAMEQARQMGKVRAYGWSTDLSQSVRAVAGRSGFAAVQHAMNIFIDAPAMQAAVAENQLHAFIRSPLSMGLLSGKYHAASVMPAGDIRATANTVTSYFRDARPNPLFLAQLDAVRELVTTGGRSPAQGALSWLWAKSCHNIPIPGARTAAQMEGLADALAFGPLPGDVMSEIERVLARPVEEERPR